MSENPIAISNLNDFIFCPVSIYFHSLDYDTEKMTYQNSDQLNGTAVHTTVDSGTYSSKKSMLQSITLYSEKYNLSGKIDLYDSKKFQLIERKKKVHKIYDGYVFQVYAQYFGLLELGYRVDKITIHSIDDNKTYPIPLPSEDNIMFSKFENLIDSISDFQFDDFKQSNINKCNRCIYEPLCSFSALKE